MRIKLSTRIMLSVVIAQAIMLVLLVANSVRLINTSHAEIMEQYITESSQLLSLSLQPGLIAHDIALINDAISLLENKPNFAYLIVYDSQGNILSKKLSNNMRLENYLSRPQDQSFEDALTDNIYDIQHEIHLFGQHLGTLSIGYSLNKILEFSRQTRQQNTFLAIIGLLLSIIISIFLGLLLTRNLRTLEDGARALQSGQLDYRIKLDSNDEIGDVAQSFNQLAQHLQSTQKSLDTERAALETEANRLETLLNGVNAVLLEIDPDTHNFSYASEGSFELLGYQAEEWLQPGFWIQHIHPEDHNWVIKTIMQHNQQPGDYSIDYRMRHINGDYLWVRSIHTIELDEQGKKQSRALMLDITEQKKTEDHIVYLAERDALTGLFNRRRFQEELENRIAYSKRFNQQGALLFIDLDEFKYINDTLGHQTGDDCLLSVSHALSSAIREIDTLARLGGDEFAIILANASEQDAVQVAENLIITLLNKTILPVELSMRISASIGITLFPEHGITPSELLAKADAAMYTAKRNGRNQVHVYRSEDTELLNMQNKVHWEDRIRRALENDHFVLHYQPVINLASGEIAHYEALLRMDDNGELIFPGAFLDTAERFNLIQDIDKWVLLKAIEAQANSIKKGTSVSIAVNLSGRHFGHQDVMHLVENALEKFGADPAALIFEVTETAAVENFTQARRFIESLRSLGCRFALDDFGMGYSSFHYLKNLPVDMVKIDGSFVRNLHLNEFDRIIVKAMSDLASGMNIYTVAEFVENEEIRVLLEKLGVDYGQGYHLGMPDRLFAHEREVVLSSSS
ncbi:MAG: EAL domain-containing protein [Thioalkalispiraceae bacterium]